MNYLKMDKSTQLVHYKIFESFNNLLAFTTTKHTLNANSPRFTGDSESTYKPNRILLSEILNIPEKQFVFPRQTHTNCVAEIQSIPETEFKETDALITDKAEICICVQTADCVPVLMYDSAQHIIAVVHAGWRGTVNKIAEKAIQKLISKYDSHPENIFAAIGPSIGPKVYEVGNEVVELVRQNFHRSEKLLAANHSGKFHFNLWEANKQLLLTNHIPDKNIEVLGECSYELTGKYYSARREGIETGRMVSGIYLKS